MKIILFFTIIQFFTFTTVFAQTVFGPQQVISTDGHNTVFVHTADLNGDGNLDVISVSLSGDQIYWYANDGKGNFSETKIISTYVDGPRSVYAADLDNDGDMDVLSASTWDNRIAWFENDGDGNFSNIKTIAICPGPARAVSAADLDKDGDMDVLSAFSDSDVQVAWYENDGTGDFGHILLNRNVIATTTYQANCVYTADLDGDGDIDVLSVSVNTDKIFWYENDGKGVFNNEYVVSTDVEGPNTAYPADLDNDGDIDILSSSSDDDKIAWYPNDGNGNFGNQIVISKETNYPSTVYAADLDNDGDMDVLSISYNVLVWYENQGSGSFGNQNVISTEIEIGNSVCAADLDGDKDLDVLSASSNNGDKVAWYENLLNNTKISSLVFQDSNENGLYENNEKPLNNQKIFLEPSADAAFTNLSGNTCFFVENGDYQISSEPNTLWELTTNPEIYDITVTENSELPTYYFGFKPTRILPRVVPHLNSSSTRCNTEVSYWLNCINTGTTLANGTITLEVDELMEFISSNPEPNLIEGRKLTWNITDLHPSFEKYISLQFQIPDFNSIGEILETKATVQLFNESQELVSSKSTEYDSEVRCSYDPNDKLARSNILGQSEFAYIADTILYTVRFQNTGNDTAFNIRIEDTLDKKLDWPTFHPITASHDYRTELNRETGLATFYFNDILLPDSTTNEVESHGFVTFGIASLEGIEDKTKVENTASIFFDFNPPIITNTPVLTLLQQVETDIEVLENGASIRVFPNPFSDFTTIEAEELPQGNYRLQVMDILGRKVMELKSIGNEEWRIERGDLKSGVYFWRILEEGNQAVLGSGKVLVE
ncbi:MAG: FG-GAP-like repeat-containing protein [Chitinophagales bacterium]